MFYFKQKIVRKKVSCQCWNYYSNGNKRKEHKICLQKLKVLHFLFFITSDITFPSLINTTAVFISHFQRVCSKRGFLNQAMKHKTRSISMQNPLLAVAYPHNLEMGCIVFTNCTNYNNVLSRIRKHLGKHLFCNVKYEICYKYENMYIVKHSNAFVTPATICNIWNVSKNKGNITDFFLQQIN